VRGDERERGDVTAGAGLNGRLLRWRAGGRLEEVARKLLFVRNTEGHGPLLLFLHGFPSSSYDWRQVIPAFSDRSTLALDFLGFGFSDKPPRARYSLLEQADRVEALVARHARTPIVIIAHDMGTSVATELMARDIDGALGFSLAGVLLFNGSIIIERASLTWAQKLLRSRLGPIAARLGNERLFERQFARVFSSEHPLSSEEAEDQWELWRHGEGHRLAHRLVSYLEERARFAARWHGAIREWPGPLRLAWGLRDPVATPAVLAGLCELRPGAPVTELPGLGHYPQIEQPDAIVAAVLELLSAT
jgi:pimeloyl-ACP methyl ester carboxylesterase